MLFCFWQYSHLQIVMWSISRVLLLGLIIIFASSSYLQFSLLRIPVKSQSFTFAPVTCKNESTINQDAQYKQICYEKDISYVIPFIKDGQHFGISADFTTPISWLKTHDCLIEGTGKRCERLIQTISDKAKEVKKKIVGKFKKHDKKDVQVENAIIEGSSQIIKGQIEQSKNISFTTKDSSRLNNMFQLIMLGLFIYGQKDSLTLQSTNFINAISISPNLNSLSDGAISMRFDQSSQNSFLNEIFSYVKATQKTVTVYLGANQTLTIGDMTAKYTESGYSSINWVDMPDDQGFGKMAQISDIAIEDRLEDSEDDNSETLPAILTLSASYIGLPEFAINELLKSFKNVTCHIDAKTYYLTCQSTNKKNLEKIVKKNLIFGFGDKKQMIPMEKLVLKDEHGKKIIFNIKKTFNSRAILGEPIFKQYFMIFDYSKNRIGFSPKRQRFNQFFVNVITLVRFLCFVFVLGCSFIICYQPIKKMFKAFSQRGFKRAGKEGRRLKQYSPIQQNPYEDLKGKIQDVISSTQKQSDEI